MHNFSSILTIMPHRDNDYKAVLKELHSKDWHIEEMAAWKSLYIFNSKGDNLIISQIQTLLVMSDYYRNDPKFSDR